MIKPSNKRKFEMWAAYTDAFGVILSSVFGYITHTGLFDQHREKPGTPGQIAVVIGFLLAHAFFVWKGKVWAKSLMLFFIIGGAAYSFYAANTGQHPSTDTAYNAHNIIQWIIQIATAILLILSFQEARTSNDGSVQVVQ
ncbi:MAG: hypothetical protein ACRYFZ_03825 [Janthinobacterium lividum]